MTHHASSDRVREIGMRTCASRVAVIALDWNGTVVEDADRARTATNAVLAARGIGALDERAFGAAFRLPLSAFFAELGVPERGMAPAVAQWNRVMATLPARLVVGARRLLAAASVAGIPVGVVSAADRDLVLGDARDLGVDQALSFVVGAVVDKAVPLAELVRLADGAVLYAGDAEHDIDAALRAGAVPLGVATGYRPAAALRAAGAVAVLDDLGEFADHVAGGFRGIAVEVGWRGRG